MNSVTTAAIVAVAEFKAKIAIVDQISGNTDKIHRIWSSVTLVELYTEVSY